MAAKEIQQIFSETIRLYQNPVTAGPLDVWDALEINLSQAEKIYADEVAKENLRRELIRQQQPFRDG